MAKILYSSCHSVLEYSEVKLLTELGHDVFSMGAYSNPAGNSTLHRPGIPGLPHYPEYERIERECARTALPTDFLKNFDLVIVMHTPEVLIENWPRFKEAKNKVVWRSIGQSLPPVERMLKPLRDQGLKILRYSPKEQKIPNYIGADAVIRFYEDPEQFQGWVGNNKEVINFTQSLRGRGNFCHYDDILKIMSGFNAKIYGTGNNDLGNLNGGQLPYDLMRGKMRDARVYLYAGTYPAPYTLTFMEALMTGIPVVSIGKKMANINPGLGYDFFEIPDIIENGKHGFFADDIGELKSYIQILLNDDELAKKMSEHGRAKAKEIFGKSIIKSQWGDFLNKI